MDVATKTRSTIHIEVLLANRVCSTDTLEQIDASITRCLSERYVSVRVGENLSGYGMSSVSGMVRRSPVPENDGTIERVVVADCVGPDGPATYHATSDAQPVVQIYSLHAEQVADARKRARLSEARDESDTVQTRILRLPNIILSELWESLIFDDALPARILRMLVRMLDIMRQPGLNSHTFNWNRLCLFHGLPGSGKSTLCRALAQKLSIRLGRIFKDTLLFDVNCNTMLSRYFGQSGKLIDSLFQQIVAAAQSTEMLICVIMDEIETIASHRDHSSDSVDCRDGLRATNQLLTALDRLRMFPNIIVLCTSNLIAELDPAFLDRIDKKILIPSLSPTAIYAILRSCLNELVESNVIENTHEQIAGDATNHDLLHVVPSFNEMTFLCHDNPESPGRRLWQTAQLCKDFSGRLLRRLPILALAEYTWDKCTLDEAITALESAAHAEITDRMRKHKAS